MALRKKLKKAKAANNVEAVARLTARLKKRNDNWKLAKLYMRTFLLPIATGVASKFDFGISKALIQLPLFKNTAMKNMNKFEGLAGFAAELLKRLFSDKPRFFTWGQRAAAACTGLLGILKFISDPAYGFNLYDQVCVTFWFIQNWCFIPEVLINYAIVGCLAIIGAFQLPTESLNDKAARS